MARRASVRYWSSRQAYCCWFAGKQHILAEGPDDYPSGPTFQTAAQKFAELSAVVSANSHKLIARGAGRAYGDAALNAENRVACKRPRIHLLYRSDGPALRISPGAGRRRERAARGEEKSMSDHFFGGAGRVDSDPPTPDI